VASMDDKLASGKDMRTHYVVCKDCGKEIARWGGGNNWQKEEEWVCQGKVTVDCSRENVFYNTKEKTRSHVFVMDGGAGTQVETPPDSIRLEKETRSCNGVNDTTYCKSCAKKHGYKCPICGAGIKKERDKY